jgi:hypothetical protein
MLAVSLWPIDRGRLELNDFDSSESQAIVTDVFGALAKAPFSLTSTQA